MTNNEYAVYVAQRCNPYVNLNYCIIALNGEAGEVAEWYKKYVLRENPDGTLTDNNLKDELGDVLFYLVRTAALLGWTLEDIMDANKAKLDTRMKAKGKATIHA